MRRRAFSRFILSIPIGDYLLQCYHEASSWRADHRRRLNRVGDVIRIFCCPKILELAFVRVGSGSIHEEIQRILNVPHYVTTSPKQCTQRNHHEREKKNFCKFLKEAHETRKTGSMLAIDRYSGREEIFLKGYGSEEDRHSG